MMPPKWSDEAGFLLSEAVDGRELARPEQHAVINGGVALEDRETQRFCCNLAGGGSGCVRRLSEVYSESQTEARFLDPSACRLLSQGSGVVRIHWPGSEHQRRRPGPVVITVPGSEDELVW